MKKKVVALTAMAISSFSLAIFASCKSETEFALAKTQYWIGSYAEVEVELTTGDAKDLEWSSADETVVKVEDGLLIAQGADAEDRSTTVTVSNGKDSETITVSVVSEGKPKIELADVFMYSGATLVLEPSVVYSEAKVEKSFTYTVTSADTSVVTADGLTLTGVSAGETSVTVATEYKGLNLRKTVNVEVESSFYIRFESTDGEGETVYDQLTIYNSRGDFGSAVLNPVVCENAQIVENANVTYEIVEGDDVVELDGKTVTALSEGTAKIKASYNGIECILTVTVEPNWVSADLYVDSRFQTQVVKETDGDFAGAWKYTNGLGGQPAKDYGECGVFFDGLVGGLGAENYRANDRFFSSGYVAVQTLIYIEDSVSAVRLRFDVAGWTTKTLTVGANLSDNGNDYYLLDANGEEIVEKVESNTWYTLYIVVEPELVDYAKWTYAGIYTDAKSVTSETDEETGLTTYSANPAAVMYLKDVRFIMDIPEEFDEMFAEAKAWKPYSTSGSTTISKVTEGDDAGSYAVSTTDGWQKRAMTFVSNGSSMESLLDMENANYISLKIKFTEAMANGRIALFADASGNDTNVATENGSVFWYIGADKSGNGVRAKDGAELFTVFDANGTVVTSLVTGEWYEFIIPVLQVDKDALSGTLGIYYQHMAIYANGSLSAATTLAYFKEVEILATAPDYYTNRTIEWNPYSASSNTTITEVTEGDYAGCYEVQVKDGWQPRALAFVDSGADYDKTTINTPGIKYISFKIQFVSPASYINFYVNRTNDESTSNYSASWYLGADKTGTNKIGDREEFFVYDMEGNAVTTMVVGEWYEFVIPVLDDIQDGSERYWQYLGIKVGNSLSEFTTVAYFKDCQLISENPYAAE